MRFQDKSAIVTGAASGIGRAVARRLASEGARETLCDWNAEGASAAAEEIGGTARAVPLDVSDAQACHAAVEEAVAAQGGLDILCNIAGVLDIGPFAAVTPERWARTIAVNLTGVYAMSHAAMPHLLERRGTIVNMASAAGLVGVPFNAAYTASKHGVVGLTKALALEFAKSGVRVNAVCPTGVNTPMLGAPPADGVDWPLVMRAAPWLDDGALCEPEDIADAVAFLASHEARRITGIAFPVDGGQTAS